MSYTELLDRFWGMDRNFSFAERTLYLFLLHYCNSLDWPDTFSLSNDEISERLNCSPNSIRTARKTLIDSRLIFLHTGNGKGVSTLYSIAAEGTPEASAKGAKFEPFSDPKGAKFEPFNNPKGAKFEPFENVSNSNSAEGTPEASAKGAKFEPFSDPPKEKQNEKENFPPAPLIKKKINKKKITQSLNDFATTQVNARVHARVHTHEGEDGQMEIVFKELEQKPPKKKREPVEPVLPQDMYEVISFFEQNGGQLQDWKVEAEAFYYHFESLGWMGTSNRKIQDWKSRASLWIADKTIKEKQEKQKNYGTTIHQQSNDRAARAIETAELVERLLREDEEEQRGVPH